MITCTADDIIVIPLSHIMKNKLYVDKIISVCVFQLFMACIWTLHELQCLFIYWNLRQFRNLGARNITESQINYNTDLPSDAHSVDNGTLHQENEDSKSEDEPDVSVSFYYVQTLVWCDRLWRLVIDPLVMGLYVVHFLLISSTKLNPLSWWCALTNGIVE